MDLVIPVDAVTGGSMMQKPNNSEKDAKRYRRSRDGGDELLGKDKPEN